MLPANHPDKDAIISHIIEDLLTGNLRREDVRARLKSYIAAEGKFASSIMQPRFGQNRLYSLDAKLFDDGPLHGAIPLRKRSGTSRAGGFLRIAASRAFSADH
jgi:hypothetical protein